MRKISILQQILTLKEAILFCKFLHENSVDRKNKVDHDEASGKSHKTVISDFLFLKLYHRDFSPQSFFFLHFFQKPQKEAILFCKFLHENWADRKNGVHHDKANGKSFETVISDFWILKLCHRDISPQSSLLLASRLDKQTFCGKF